MTAFTISSGGTTEWDSLTGGSVNAVLDTYTISNNSTLRIATDSYQCAGHSAAFGSLDTVTYTGIGGRLLIDGTLVRVIPFTGGSGTVPAIGASIVQGAVSGPLLGVWANWQSEPLAAAAAMPATGFIKIKSKTGGNFAAGVLTGITATASGPDGVGWIEVRGADTATITVPRVGRFETIGDWFELGTTTGVRGQVLACPTTATILGVFPGIWVETAAASGVYERWFGVGSMVNLATNATDERGKMFWQIATGIRIGSDGTNNVGFLPPAGCRVRIPNVILTCCTRTAAGSGIRVLPNATFATRQEFVTSSAGDIRLGNCVFQWYGNFLQAFRADVLNCAISDSLILQEIASAINVNNVIVSPTQAQLNNALNMVSCFGGGAIQNSLFSRFSTATGTYVAIASYINGVTFTNCKVACLTPKATSTGGVWLVTQANNCTFSLTKNIGGRMAFSASQKCTVNDTSHADNIAGTTVTGSASYAFDLSLGCADMAFSGLDFFGLANQQPRAGLLTANACYRTVIRNIGTAASPLDMGTVNPALIGVNGGGNNDGITIQRVFLSNTGTGPYLFLNSDNNVLLEQVAGDYADTSTIASLNTVAKGITAVGATTGQVSVYGTHWRDSFSSATVGKIEISCNEPTLASAAQCSSTSGTPRFNSSGSVALTTIGDQVTWEMSYFAEGHTALANLAPTLTGIGTANLNYEFQYDKGSGYNGTWLVLSAANLTGAGAITPSVGVKLKVRATCAVAGATNLLTNIAIPTVTSTTDQNAIVYPLSTVPVTFESVVIGSRLYVIAAAGGPLPVGTVIYSNDITASPVTFNVEFTGNQPILYRVRKATSAPFYKPIEATGTIVSTGFSTVIQQVPDA